VSEDGYGSGYSSDTDESEDDSPTQRKSKINRNELTNSSFNEKYLSSPQHSQSFSQIENSITQSSPDLKGSNVTGDISGNANNLLTSEDNSDSSYEEIIRESTKKAMPPLFAGSDTHRLQMYISSIMISYENTERLMKQLHINKSKADQRIDELQHDVENLKQKLKEQNEHILLMDARNVTFYSHVCNI
jgi:hypothetical protein